jgi:hypothetical protein
MEKIKEGADRLKDKPRDLAAYTRKFANDKKEAWSTGGAGSIFDNVRLSDLLYDVEKDQTDDPTGGFIEFNLP